ncbi:MAG: SprT family zinc-dependent metalloprotease [Clostridia bacterium]
MFVDGNDVEVVKKKIKYLHLYVLSPDGKVRVSAPQRMSLSEIESFVHEKHAWISANQEKILKRPKKQSPTYVDGEKITLFDKQFTLILNPSCKANSVTVNGDNVILNTRGELSFEQKAKIVEKWRRAELKIAAAPLIEKWQAILGVSVNVWSVKNMKTRWGSCNVKSKRVWLNFQLSDKPSDCLEFIVAHELCHLRVPNHSKTFKSLLSSVLPNWRDTQKRLNTFGIN